MKKYPDHEVAVQKVLTEPPYAVEMLLTLISRDVFKNLTNFFVFDSCIENVPVKQLEELSTVQANEDKFMEFMRFVSM